MVDDAGNIADMHMSAELYGMFFVAEDVFGGENAGRPLELTCYRRNLWQCSGQITLPRAVSHVVDEQGRQFPIFELSASITAVESIEGKTTEIISIPWKSSTPQQVNEENKVASAPPHVSLDLSTGQELDASRVSLPVSWKRLQFKHATANNGRRKGLQQHYVVQINLLGKAKSGDMVKIAEIQSGPVIVRGRSPRNFDSRRDVPLTGEKRVERKNTASSDTSLKMERENLQATMQRFQSIGGVSVCQDIDSQSNVKLTLADTRRLGKRPAGTTAEPESSPKQEDGDVAHHRETAGSSLVGGSPRKRESRIRAASPGLHQPTEHGGAHQPLAVRGREEPQPVERRAAKPPAWQSRPGGRAERRQQPRRGPRSSVRVLSPHG